jgi:hypothetical protein
MSTIRIVMLAVATASVTVTVGQSQSGTLRLYSSSDTVPLDVNGFLLNPRWLNSPGQPPNIERLCRFRVISGHLDDRRLVATGPDPCLSEDERHVVTLNETPETLAFGLVCSSNTQTGEVRGHINWFPVTVTGQVRWRGFSGGVGEDYDLSLDLAPPAPNATTSGNDRAKELGNQPVYELELYKRETLDSLPSVADSVPVSELSWWHLLKRSLNDTKQMERLVNGRFAIVTGVFGLDGIHDFQAELHPVLAMAVLLSAGPTGGGAFREEWAVMLRNRGNEGECAIGRLPLNPTRDSLQTFFVDLGVWDRAGTPQVRLGPSWGWGTSVPRVKRDREHLYIAFTQTRPDPASSPSLFLGTLIVEWPAQGSGGQLARLEPWRPPHAPPLTVERLKPDSLVGQIRQTAMELLPGLSGSRVLGDTSIRDTSAARRSRLPAVQLEPLDSAWAVRRRTEATLAHLVSPPVTDFCDQERDFDNPACTSKFRLIGGVTNTPSVARSWGGFGSAYWLPRGLGFMKHVPLVGEGLYGLGWRLDVRPDRFAESCRTTCSGATVRGFSVRGSGQFAPNRLALWRFGTLTPYFVFGAGAFWPENRRVNGTWNVGFGGEFQTIAPTVFPVFRTIFAELQNYLSGGGLQSHWSVNFGTVISLRPVRSLLPGQKPRAPSR